MVRIAVHGGEGIGPEVTEAALEVLTSVADVEVLPFEGGPRLYKQEEVIIREEDLADVANSRAVLFGATETPPGYPSLIVTLRKHLRLFANVRPVQNAARSVDLVIYRELSEGLYRYPGFESDELALDLKVATPFAVRRFLTFVLDHAGKAGRTRFTLFHKANILVTDRLWLNEFRRLVPQGESVLVDSGLLKLATKPQSFDAIVAENLYGDLLADLAAMHAGSLGLLPSASYGDGPPLFEPVHGSAPDIAGQGVANPAGAILSVALLLKELGQDQKARQVEAAVWAAVQQRPTPDLGGCATTKEFTATVLNQLEVAA